MTSTASLVVPSSGAAFELRQMPQRELRDNDVLIDVKFAGICHSDIHQARGEWGEAIFPMVPGHEIAGVVSAVGSAVTRHQVGDRVGVGCMVDSCRECAQCKDGREMFCERGAVMTYNGVGYDGDPTYGGYSRSVVVREEFVVRIPEGVELDVAAPLLCAGITMWEPLKRFSAGPGKRVAVVGLGGLGHMAVKLGVALGAEVEVLSRTDAKRDDALALGAAALHPTADTKALRGLRQRYDLIVNTVSAGIDMRTFLGLLKPLGALVNVGVGDENYSIPPFSLIGGNRILAGSNIGGIPATQEMLDFCAEHGIGATIETIGAEDVDAAYDRVVAGGVKFRYVIDTSTITG